MESPVRRCFVHAGLPKTGTTSLQSLLWRSRDALRRQGVRMLPRRRRDHFFVALALRDLLDEAIDKPAAFEALDRLRADAGRVPGSTALLTQEALAPATPDQVGRLVETLAGWEVHVILTARDLQRQLPSAWQQRMQARHTYRYDEFLAAARDRDPLVRDFWINQDLPAIAASWASVVTAGRVHVVTVPPADAAKDSLLDRFCSVVGVDPGSLAGPSEQRNPSLGLAQAELLRRVNVALGDRLPHQRSGYTRVARGYLANQVLAAQAGAAAQVPKDYADWCMELSRTWIAQLDQAGYDVVGDLQDLLPSRPWPDQVELSEDAVLGSAVEALASVLVDRHHAVEESEGRPPADAS